MNAKKRLGDVVVDVVHREDVVIDDPLDEIERTPPCEQHADVRGATENPVWPCRQRPNGKGRADDHERPRRQNGTGRRPTCCLPSPTMVVDG